MAKKKNLAWLDCSEEELVDHLKEWLKVESLENTVMLLEGEMGSGKSTFVRHLLQFLAPDARTQGSPTFPLVQEYRAEKGIRKTQDIAKATADDFTIYHIDLYRLKNEQELEDSGIEAQVEEKGALACVEWPSLFPHFYAYWSNPALSKRKRVILVELRDGGTEERRSYHLSYL